MGHVVLILIHDSNSPKHPNVVVGFVRSSRENEYWLDLDNVSYSGRLVDMSPNITRHWPCVQRKTSNSQLTRANFNN